MIGLKYVHMTIDKIKINQNRLKVALDRQKSHVDVK